jgi:hypothetical protein
MCKELTKYFIDRIPKTDWANLYNHRTHDVSFSVARESMHCESVFNTCTCEARANWTQQYDRSGSFDGESRPDPIEVCVKTFSRSLQTACGRAREGYCG